MSDLICRSCGAKIEYAAEEKSLKCLYCGTVNEIHRPEDALPDAVDAIIPMGMSVEALERSAQAYMAQGDFTPDDMLEVAVFTRRERLYVPAHRFIVSYEATWTASFGYDRTEHYTEFVSVTKYSNGRSYTVQEPRTRKKTVTDWRPANGTDAGSFSVATYAGKLLNESALAPGDLVPEVVADGAITAFNDSFMKGIESESFTLPEAAALTGLKGEIDEHIDGRVRSHGQGDRQKDWHWRANYSHDGQTVYVPICHAVFDYQGTEYHYWTHGVDGSTFRADALPEDANRRTLANKGFVPAIAGAVSLVATGALWSVTQLGVLSVLLAAGYGWLRRKALLDHSKLIRESLLTQTRASSSTTSGQDYAQESLDQAYQRPKTPALARTDLDAKLVPGLAAAMVLLVAVPSYLDHRATLLPEVVEQVATAAPAEAAPLEETPPADVVPLAGDAAVQSQEFTLEGLVTPHEAVFWLDSNPDDQQATAWAFSSGTTAGDTVLATCPVGSRCRVTGTVGDAGALLTVSAVTQLSPPEVSAEEPASITEL
jgi:hypothetical protein